MVRTCRFSQRHQLRSRSCGLAVLQRVIKRKLMPHTLKMYTPKLPIAPAWGSYSYIYIYIYINIFFLFILYVTYIIIYILYDDIFLYMLIYIKQCLYIHTINIMLVVHNKNILSNMEQLELMQLSSIPRTELNYRLELKRRSESSH